MHLYMINNYLAIVEIVDKIAFTDKNAFTEGKLLINYQWLWAKLVVIRQCSKDL